MCQQTKALTEFPRYNYTTRTGKISFGFLTTCVECRNQRDREAYAANPEKHRKKSRDSRLRNPERAAATSKRYQRANPEKMRMWKQWQFSRDIERKYGITFERYQELVRTEGIICAICRSTEKIGIDHCHASGRFRGFLCSGCNLAIGNIRESADRAEGLAKYIRERCATQVSG